MSPSLVKSTNPTQIYSNVGPEFELKFGIALQKVVEALRREVVAMVIDKFFKYYGPAKDSNDPKTLLTVLLSHSGTDKWQLDASQLSTARI